MTLRECSDVRLSMGLEDETETRRSKTIVSGVKATKPVP
jgi:hypothetical protein